MKVRKKNVSRISALLLALVMMLSLVPTTVFAAGSAQDTTIVIAGSDFQNQSTKDPHGEGVKSVKSLLAPIRSAIATKYGVDKKVDGFLFCGDYYKDNDNIAESTNGLNALKQCVKSELGDGVNALYVQGNHDLSGVPFDSTGAHDAATYGVYEMNWGEYNGYNASYSASQTMASNLTKYFADRKANHPNQPIFIISHQGLHAGPRTIWGNSYDNCALYAMPIFNAINEAAEDLNIIFLFAHNHSKDFDSYLGGSAVFLTKGDTMLVSNATNSSGRKVSSFTEQTLNFTYMNAGYVGYYESYSDADDALTMSCFEINGNEVTISRYDTTGIHNLKAAGDHTDCTKDRGTEMNNFVAQYAPDTKVYTSPMVVGKNPAQPEEHSYTDSDTGISVTTVNGTGLTVAANQTIAQNLLDAENIGNYKAYEITVEGFTNGEDEATVSIPVPGDFDTTRTKVFHVGSDGLEDMNATIGEDRKATFTTNSFSPFVLGETLAATPGGSDDPGESNENTITLFVGNSKTVTIDGQYYTSATNNDDTVVGVTVDGTEGHDTQTTTTYEYPQANNVSCNSIISTNQNNWTQTNYYYMVDGNYYPLYAMRSPYYYSNNRYNYTWGYSKTGNTTDVTQIGTQTNARTSDAPKANNRNITLYTRTETTTTIPAVPASTKVTFKGLAVGETTVTVGNITYTVKVIEKPAPVENPEYPNQGAVKVDKNGNGIDFTSTGVAKINLSTVGVPMNKGVDVIVMLDTSSSMTRDANNQDTSVEANQRITMLKNSLVEMTKTFQTENADGSKPDIRMAIADFNGFTYLSGTSAMDYIGQQNYDQKPTAQVYTGDKKLDAGAFVDVNGAEFNITAINNALTTTSGTNYDDAFDRIYQLGTAITEQNQTSDNERDRERELVVIFMSDGATFQYNYFHSRNNQSAWAQWLDGSINMNGSNVHSNNHKYFKNGADNSHRMANAIKGSPDDKFEVIRPDDKYGTPTDQDYMYNVRGLGATLYTIGFCITEDGSVPKAAIEANIERLASVKDGESLYFDAKNEAALTDAFNRVANNIKQAATNAYFTDTMGEAYDLKMDTVTYNLNGTSKTIKPTIEVTAFDAYKRSDIGKTVNGEVVTEDMVGKTYGTGDVKETITFNANGTEAYSDKKTGNIMNEDGVICAQNFYYNTNKSTAVEVDGITIDPETFYWKIGTISEKVLNLSYYVYLTGSMEGTRPAGSYPTNKSATLHYDNYLGHEAHKDTVSPVLPWKDANVSYAFYLVNEAGQPVNRNGEVVTFANKVAMSKPYVYQSINLNSSGTVGGDSMDVTASKVLPDGYELFNKDATYTITVRSDGNGSNWNISDAPGTTYVTDYKGNEYTNQSHNGSDVDYTHTTVWFAVKYMIKAIPDVVVIDYGLPVDIHVLENDMFGEYGTLAAVGKDKPADKTPLDSSKFVTKDLGLDHGKAEMNSDKVRYTPTDMKMDAPEKFAYAVNYVSTTEANNGYYYGDVTVIPATTIYYEDSFVSTIGNWIGVGEYGNGVQAEDRPGLGNLIDANNVYGFDKAYENFTSYSMGSAKRVTVSKGATPWPTASFTFTGTGFDVISLTSNMTGYIQVEVKDSNDKVVARYGVDTYYGYTIDKDNPYVKTTYTKGESGEWHQTDVEFVKEKGTDTTTDTTRIVYTPNWIVTNEANNALYQIPVIKSADFDYGTYTVTITPMYASVLDHNTADASYDFYLDAIRIYNPAKNNEDAIDAYLKDNEAYPQYIELRNNLIAAGSFNEGMDKDGLVFIDGYGETDDISAYTAYGPNNEVYLSQGQSVAFMLDNRDAAKIASIQLGVKAPNGTAQITIGTVGSEPRTISTSTATDRYYDISDIAVFDKGTHKTGVIVITNPSDKLVSITNIKTTYKKAPADANSLKMVMSASAARMAVQSVKAMYQPASPVEEVVEPQVFTPAKCEVSLNKTSVKVGDKITVTVKTSADVNELTVNGEKATLTKTDRKTGEKTWTYTFKAAQAGQLAISVTAYDSAGLASEAIDNVITVTAKNSIISTVSKSIANAISNSIGAVINRVLSLFS